MTSRYRSLPEFLRTPWCLLWAGLIPQALLVLLNLRAWFLVRGEVSEAQIRRFALLGGYEIVMLLAMALLLAVCRARQRPLGWVACIPLFLAHVAYLWVVTTMIDDLLPREVTRWMLPPSVFLFTQYTLMMPGVFYFAARVACFPMTRHPLKDIGITTGALIGVPVLWYVVFHALSGWRRYNGPEVVWIVFWVVATIVMIMAFLRLLMMAYKRTQRIHRRRWILVLLAGFAAPLGGLALNVTIPFPVDLQYPVIYGLTLLNAIVLMIPRVKHERWMRALWFARCAMLPFSLYFFLLFLPFLPLALPAMFAIGSGLLILAPTLLFSIHVQVLLDEGKHVAALQGRVKTALCIVVALALMPGLLTVDALLDRRNLSAAIDAVYTSDTLAQPRISARRATQALKRLHADKQGVYLPFVSGAYRQLVFDGMVLQDRKIAAMYEIFSGESLEATEGRQNRNLMSDMWTGWRGTASGRGVPPPPRTVSLDATDLTHVHTDGMITATVALTMTNDRNASAEFITRLDLSPGVLVSGYWLDVEGEKKPGRLYEKRAAMWVYHMIRDITRRDPGLLIYETPTTLKLNVFPFAPNQTRRTGIEFLFPAGLPATVKIDGKTLELAPENVAVATEPLLLRNETSATHVLAISGATPSGNKDVSRTPLIHLLVDRSAPAAAITGAQWQSRLSALETRLPGNARFHVSAVNHTTHNLTDRPVGFAAARDALVNLDEIKPTGGVAHHQAIRRGVAAWLELPLADRRESVPLFVLLTSPDITPTPIETLNGLAAFTPDVEGYWIDTGEALTYHAYRSADAQPAERVSPPRSVVLPLANSAECQLPGRATTLLITDPLPNLANTPIRSELAARYVTGMALWSQWYSTEINPSLLDTIYSQLVADSRTAGIMLPVTSFMVVENSAQEEMLERKHREASKADSALDFDEHQESPEPAFWLLLIPVLLLAHRRRKAPENGRL